MRHLRIKEKPLMKKPVHIALLLGTSAIDGCSIMPELMPAPNIYVQGDGYPEQCVAQHLRSNDIDLMYVTDRAPEQASDGTLN